MEHHITCPNCGKHDLKAVRLNFVHRDCGMSKDGVTRWHEHVDAAEVKNAGPEPCPKCGEPGVPAEIVCPECNHEWQGKPQN